MRNVNTYICILCSDDRVIESLIQWSIRYSLSHLGRRNYIAFLAPNVGFILYGDYLVKDQFLYTTNGFTK